MYNVHNTIIIRCISFPVAMETKLVPNTVQGPLVFPSYSDGSLSSPMWTKSGKQYITLPKEIFNGESSSSTNGKFENSKKY